MNILHIEDEPWDSGIADYAVTLAAEQVRRGQHVAFWGRRGSPVLARAAQLRLSTQGWRGVPWGLSELPDARRAMAAFAPHVINAHTGSGHVFALLLAPAGAAIVRTRGDARPPRANLLTRWVASRTPFVIAANTALQSQLRLAFPNRPVRLIRQGIAGPPEISALPQAPCIGMIARMDPVKGHDVLLRVAAQLQPQMPDLQINCAGDGRLLTPLRGTTTARGLDGVVHFLGRVPDRWKFLAAHRIGVVASLASEAVSRAALEWMAAGRPLVATRVGGLPDIVEESVTGLLVAPGDADALADALRQLLTNPRRTEAMGQAGRRRWEQLFSLIPFYRRTQNVYEEALHSLPH